MTDSTSLTTMSNLSSTSTEPHEEAGNSFVHSVRKYDLKDQVYPLVRHMDYVHEFAASTTSLQQSCFLYTLYLLQKRRERRCLVAD